jgi:hypothetical protein
MRSCADVSISGGVVARILAWAKRENLTGSGGWSEDQEKTARLLNEEITKRLDVQRESGKAVDTQAAVSPRQRWPERSSSWRRST